ncbi:hypothetical protein ACI3PL_26095, partial [Lacticaseibacillus paracasei]
MTNKAYASYQQNVSNLNQNSRSNAILGGAFKNVTGSTTVKSEYNRSDYNQFRDSGMPLNRGSTLKLCQHAYDR